MTTTAAKPRRRWLQFNLKGLMLLVVVVAIPCGLLKWKLVRKERERAAITEIERLGGWIEYDWQYADKNEPPGVEWLRKLLGEDFFSSVVCVDAVGDDFTDDLLANFE